MKFNPLLLLAPAIFAMACTSEPAAESTETEIKPVEADSVEAPTFQNEGHELVYEMVTKVGDHQALADKKDVVYTYTYTTADGLTDESTEKYLFDGELSYGKYHQHERTLPDLAGVIEQGYDGNEYWIKHEGVVITDQAAVDRVAFSRPTNYYWFAMMPKLLDPGLNYEHLGVDTINEQLYDVVKVSFNSDQPTDIYQVYINQETQLVDQFLFTVADFGMMDTPLLMEVEYENIDGLLIPTKRRYKRSTWDAELTDAGWTEVRWSNIKFGNGLTRVDFEK